MLADQGFITQAGAEKLKSCVKVFDQVRLVGVPISFVKCVTLTNYASQHPLAQITRRGRVEVDFDDEAERLCGGAKGVSDLLALHHARLELMLKIWRLAHGKPLAVRSRRPAVPRCLHAIDATRVHQTRPFGPSRATAMLRAGSTTPRPPIPVVARPVLPYWIAGDGPWHSTPEAATHQQVHTTYRCMPLSEH